MSSARRPEGRKSKSQHAPAAGASGGRAPHEASGATFPNFLTLGLAEIGTLLDVVREPLALHAYMLIVSFSDWRTGEFLGSYAGLIAWMTPPATGRGLKVRAPTMKQVRRVVDLLVSLHLVRRGTTNAEQGQLRLKVAPRAKEKKQGA